MILEALVFLGNQEVPVYHVELVRDYSIPYKKGLHSVDSAKILHAMLDTSPVEQFVILYLDINNNMVGAEKIAMGGLDNVKVPLNSIVRGAILAGVSKAILGHNHPSGNPTPSDFDITLTDMAIRASAMAAISIVDHVIVSPNGKHYSIWDNKEDVANRIDRMLVDKQLDMMIEDNPITKAFNKPMSNKDLILSALEKIIERDK